MFSLSTTKHKTNKFIIFLAFFLNLGFFELQSHDCISMQAAKAIFKKNHTQPITELSENITLEEAYCGQEKLNYLIKKKYNDKIGYKVGFTGKALQQRFNIDSPATGVLYKHMFLKNNSTIDPNFAYRTFIEPDFLVIVKSSKIMSAKNSLDILKNLESIHPFLEIPSLTFDKKTNVNGNMLIAANMLATKMVMGEGIKVDSSDDFLNKLANINTKLTDQNGKIIQEANTSNLMGNPINVIKWLINEYNKRGIILKKNDRLSLGSVGKLFPLLNDTSYSYTFEGLDKTISVKINTK